MPFKRKEKQNKTMEQVFLRSQFEWILKMKIVTKHQENMFDLLVFGEQPRDLIIDPVKIFGNEMIGFEGCAFYTRVSPEKFKFFGNRFYTDWFDVE